MYYYNIIIIIPKTSSIKKIIKKFKKIVLRPNPEGFVCMNWKEREGGGMEGRIQKLSLAGIRTEARAASRLHFWLRNMGQRPERTL